MDDGWATAMPDEEGLNARLMAGIDDFIRTDPRNDLRGLVIARNGRLVFEGYYNGLDSDGLHDIRSATKSITSALVGIAISERLIAGVDATVVPLLAKSTRLLKDDAGKRAITVEHLLTMASGLDANEDDPATPGYEDRLYQSADWVTFALNLPMAGVPGQRWAYASVNTFLLGALIEDAAGMPLSVYARDRLFGPLGISQYRWASTPSGRTVAQGNLSLRARDMAKFGQLYLDGGRWADVQVVPESWVRGSLVARYSVPWEGYDAYGYGWYLHTMTVEGREFRYFFASGNGGNKIYVLPDQRMVVAIQSAAYNTSYGQRRSLEILRRVLAALAA
jgi:CubicO group peptidase (beta-lactamase class C family)